MTLTRLVNLPWRLSKEQLSWLKKRMKDKRDAVRTLATEQYEIRFPPRIELDELEDDFEEDFDFYMDEETDIEKPMRSVMSRPLIFGKEADPTWPPPALYRFTLARAARSARRSATSSTM